MSQEVVTIQIAENGKSWENTPKHEQKFKDWACVSEFAYRLSLIHDTEIRVESKGNGHYYHPINANNFLNS